MTFPTAPKLTFAFTLHVDLAPPQNVGSTPHGDRRFIPITGGTVKGPTMNGQVLAGGGDWNLVQSDGIVNLFAKYIISLEEDNGTDTLITITNEGIGRASQKVMDRVFNDSDPSKASSGSMESIREFEGKADVWYTRTSPKFDVKSGSKYEFLTRSMWLGVLNPPQKQGEVIIDIFKVC